MSNVKTGDLAWLVSKNQVPYPVCTVGARAVGNVIIEYTDGCLEEGTIEPNVLHWWCEFTSPVKYSRVMPGRYHYILSGPIADKYLRKITGLDTPDNTTTVDELFSPSPLDAAERAWAKELKDKMGITLPRRKATNKEEFDAN